jgi:hypothetical protein
MEKLMPALRSSVPPAPAILSLVDCLMNRDEATPFNFRLSKKTSASQIVDRAIRSYIAATPELEYKTVHCEEGGHDLRSWQASDFPQTGIAQIR